MNANHFDALTRKLVTPTTRRVTVGALAAGGFLSLLGRGDNAPAVRAIQTTPCTLAFTAMVRSGPSAGDTLAAGATAPGELRGELVFSLAQTGMLMDGSLRLADGSALPVVGQATGYALQARIVLDQNRALVVLGVGAQEIATCQGAIDGLLTGPAPGDIGDWHAKPLAKLTRMSPAIPAAATPASAAPTVQPTTVPAACARPGEPCVNDVTCCAGSCLAGVCVAPRPGAFEPACALPGQPCQTDASCCTHTCLGGVCVEQLLPGQRGPNCALPGQPCARASDCCTLSCLGGVCA